MIYTTKGREGPNLQETPKGNRVHIVFVGRRNVGKSSLINALAGQEVALVSSVPGTTTDPVAKAMELLPVGPVLLIDTAGVDDVGDLGQERVRRTTQMLEKADLVVLVTDTLDELGKWDASISQYIARQKLPYIEVLTKVDTWDHSGKAQLPSSVLAVSSHSGAGIGKLKDRIAQAAPKDCEEPTIAGDLLSPGETAVLVVPVDKQAPKGRLILPQVQTIRDLLDHGCQALVVRDTELESALATMPVEPQLVITDSQVFHQVAQIVPSHVPLTSFSILFARYKGDLDLLIDGISALAQLQPKDRVLIAEACTHRPTNEDIGRVKIPALLRKRLGNGLEFEWAAGNDFPVDLSRYALVVHCGGCMVNRQTVLARLKRLSQARVPVVNYGMLIAHETGILSRALQPLLRLRSVSTSHCESGL